MTVNVNAPIIRGNSDNKYSTEGYERKYIFEQWFFEATLNVLGLRNSTAIALLLCIGGNKDGFALAEKTVMRYCGIKSHDKFVKARQMLVDKGILEYKEYQYYRINYDVLRSLYESLDTSSLEDEESNRYLEGTSQNRYLEGTSQNRYLEGTSQNRYLEGTSCQNQNTSPEDKVVPSSSKTRPLKLENTSLEGTHNNIINSVTNTVNYIVKEKVASSGADAPLRTTIATAQEKPKSKKSKEDEQLEKIKEQCKNIKPQNTKPIEATTRHHGHRTCKSVKYMSENHYITGAILSYSWGDDITLTKDDLSALYGDEDIYWILHLDSDVREYGLFDDLPQEDVAAEILRRKNEGPKRYENGGLIPIY